jgi:hypothetical protein
MTESERAMQLPPGRICDICIHIKRCVALGFSWRERSQCDFYPSRFIEKNHAPKIENCEA